jgi:hypothetical protein
MIKSSATTTGVIQAWPLVGQSTWRKDYAVGFAQADRLTREVGSYFFLNRGWRRWKGLFSHAGVIWSEGSWKVQVWFVGGRSYRRKYRKYRFRRWITPKVRIRWARRRRIHKLCRVLGFRRLTRRRRRHRRGKFGHRRRSFPRKPLGRLTTNPFATLPRFIRLKRRLDRRRLKRRRSNRLPRSLIRRRRRLGKWARLLRMRRHRRHGPLLEMAQLWSAPRGGTWCWIKLGRPSYLGVATLLARMKYRLRGRIEMRARRVALPLLRGALRLRGAIGVEVRCHGRFTRRQRATHNVYRAGRLGRTQVSTPQEVGFATVPLRFGAVGVTLTVSYTTGLVS